MSSPTVTNQSPKVIKLLMSSLRRATTCTPNLFNESFLAEDEAKTKVAVRIFALIDFHVHQNSSLLQFYNFSGTTGKSKTVTISHYMVIATVMMCATTYQIGNPDLPQRFQPGDVTMNSETSPRIFPPSLINENMEVFIIDRLKEILKVCGFQVAPAEMETHLAEHPFVSEVCVVGIPHEFHGELPFVFIVPEKKTAALIAKYPEEEAKLRDIIAKHVTDHKVPYKALSGGIEFVESVPKTGSGKLLRRVARDNAKRLLVGRAEQAAAAKPITAQMSSGCFSSLFPFARRIPSCDNLPCSVLLTFPSFCLYFHDHVMAPPPPFLIELVEFDVDFLVG